MDQKWTCGSSKHLSPDPPDLMMIMLILWIMILISTIMIIITAMIRHASDLSFHTLQQ